jgi:hypothetical protein
LLRHRAKQAYSGHDDREHRHQPPGWKALGLQHAGCRQGDNHDERHHPVVADDEPIEESRDGDREPDHSSHHATSILT